MHIHPSWTSYKHQKCNTEPRAGKNRFRIQNPSFPYLERASERLVLSNSEHRSSGSSLVSWNLVEQKGNEVNKRKP
ncbi:hypothetical protein DEO72_LG10g2862 [Vigna unguiculata]|uniref:Uncharacterized protein n=1 Tax=Vigna unguiculata TaxID=3917 RepID=A0A4D6NI58_VIGUN|nr:hypothetical protein DEO72_LG10g2862 [Vigna unguiculata]